MKIGVVIPANDEEQSVGRVVRRCRKSAALFGSCRIVVCDNNSSDETASVARSAGAEVTFARQRGYGNACLTAIAHLGDWPDVLVFVDADGSSRPEEIGRLLEPIQHEGVEFVLGTRPSDSPMTLPQRWGDGLATRLISFRWGTHLQRSRSFSRRSVRQLSAPRHERSHLGLDGGNADPGAFVGVVHEGGLRILG